MKTKTEREKVSKGHYRVQKIGGKLQLHNEVPRIMVSHMI